MKCEEMLQLFTFHPYCMELQGKTDVIMFTFLQDSAYNDDTTY